MGPGRNQLTPARGANPSRRRWLEVKYSRDNPNRVVPAYPVRGRFARPGRKKSWERLAPFEPIQALFQPLQALVEPVQALSDSFHAFLLGPTALRA